MRRIFITGGHYTPARAVIDELLRLGGFEIFYLGRRFSMEDDAAEALEFQELKKIKRVNYIVINTGRLQRKFFIKPFQSLKAFSKIISGLVAGFWAVLKYRPNIILSFGGYVALPVVLVGKIFGIRVVTHEQTLSLGLANKIIERLADKVLVSYPQQADQRHVYTGNPIRREILEVGNCHPRKNLIFVTGGNQGSHVLNMALMEALPTLLKKYSVVHQTGDSKFGDYDNLYNRYKNNKNYKIYRFLSGKEMAENLSLASLVICRSGANTVTELRYLGKPAILVPIFWSGGNEQVKNAQIIVRAGQGEMLTEDQLSSRSLVTLVNKMFSYLNYYQKNGLANKATLSVDAASKIVDQL
jgi:UDP-N-acetylglucosamine--N-acetylmuramyl-(pentapeptide) pyrophosphoryl-undecaprenol N-acetylglucosamine transferase